jgi:hypothetical protein
LWGNLLLKGFPASFSRSFGTESKEQKMAYRFDYVQAAQKAGGGHWFFRQL